MTLPLPENPLQQNPSPDPMSVKLFHLYSDVDSDQGAQHHTLGPGHNQAAPGSHTHNGSDSPLLFEGIVIAGSRTTGAAVQSIISLLTQQGAIDQSTA